MTTIRERLAAIEADLDADNYRPGPWSRLIRNFGSLNDQDKLALSADITRISNKLHRRNGYPALPFLAGLAIEILLLLTTLMLFDHPELMLRILAAVTLTLCLQPLIKIISGVLLGVSYSYAYLWYFEPRFKMQYGTYLCLTPMKRFILHISGSVGTPLALAAGASFIPDLPWLRWLMLAGMMMTAAMQVIAFAAAWMGVKKVGPFLLTSLTSPAAAASELKTALQTSPSGKG